MNVLHKVSDMLVWADPEPLYFAVGTYLCVSKIVGITLACRNCLLRRQQLRTLHQEVGWESDLKLKEKA